MFQLMKKHEAFTVCTFKLIFNGFYLLLCTGQRAKREISGSYAHCMGHVHSCCPYGALLTF